jgi:hypothetical protein
MLGRKNNCWGKKVGVDKRRGLKRGRREKKVGGDMARMRIAGKNK